MPSTPNAGRFVWRELATRDPARAKEFYRALFGWSYQDFTGGDEPYPMISNRGALVGGIFGIPAGAAMPAFWGSYVSVADVDEAVSRATARGARTYKPPADIPEVGRFAVLADPQGAAFLPYRSTHAPAGDAPRPQAGAFCWETLLTSDPDAALAFYREVVGWGTAPSPAGGPLPVFTAGEGPVADVQRVPPGTPSGWMTYVLVDDLEAARDTAARLGGKVVRDAFQVPNVGRVAVISDPEGAVLGLFRPDQR